MLAALTPQTKFPLLEEDTLRFWKTHRIFERAAELHQGGLPYRVTPRWAAPVHLPSFDAAIELAFLDLFLRYKTMRGYRATWQWGWNAHGLTVESGAEARLGLAGPRQVAAYGLGRFHELCKRSAFDYLVDWERLAERMGVWCDWERLPSNLPDEQIEVVWQALKMLWERGLLYPDERAVPYCPRCATPQGSPSGYLPQARVEQTEALLRLPLVEDPGTALLVWTAQPWSLLGNVAVAANPDAEYVIVEHDLPEQGGGGTEKLILARQRVPEVLGEAPIRIFESFRGSRLKGLRYRPLFTYLLPEKPAYQVVLSDSVRLEPGTGLLQLSPCFDEQARQIAQAHNLPVLETLASDGVFVSEIRPWRGLALLQAAPLIVQDLQQRGLVFGVTSREQPVPTCPDCGAALINLTSRCWYLRAAPARHRLASLARQVDWRPAQLAVDPTALGLAPAADWLVSRARTWGTPLPVWDCHRCQQSHVAGSLTELAELAGTSLANLDLHLPMLDTLELACPDCGEPMQRQPDVLDPWFELGCLVNRASDGVGGQPAAANEATDMVCSVLNQPADWLVALHLVSGLLFDHPAYHQVLWLPPARLAGPASSYEERPTPLSLLREHGADALRWTLYLHPQAAPLLIGSEMVNLAREGFLQSAWALGELLNSHVDLHLLQQPPTAENLTLSAEAVHLDNWLSSRLHSLVREVTIALEATDASAAVQALQAFIQADLVGWYVPQRLDRRHAVPVQAESYRPLFETMTVLVRLLAPLVPFLAENLYQNLRRGLGVEGYESVHLTDWPIFDPACILPGLEADMAIIRHLAALGRTARQQAHYPLHQPLAQAAFALEHPESERLFETYAALLVEDLNVRAVRFLTPAEKAAVQADERHQWGTASGGGALAALTLRLDPELVSEGLAAEFIMRVHELRQKAGLAPNERIRIVYTATARLAEALEMHRAMICAETHADALQPFTQVSKPPLSEAVKSLFTITTFNNEKLTFGIEKA